MSFKEKAATAGLGLLGALAVIVSILAVVGVAYLVVAALWWVACLGFGWTFSWGAALGAFAIVAMLSLAFGVIGGSR